MLQTGLVKEVSLEEINRIYKDDGLDLANLAVPSISISIPDFSGLNTLTQQGNAIAIQTQSLLRVLEPEKMAKVDAGLCPDCGCDDYCSDCGDCSDCGCDDYCSDCGDYCSDCGCDDYCPDCSDYCSDCGCDDCSDCDDCGCDDSCGCDDCSDCSDECDGCSSDCSDCACDDAASPL